MKTCLIALYFIVIFGEISQTLHAQTQPAKTVFEKQLKISGDAFTEKKYLTSRRALAIAKSEVDSLLKSELEKAFPAKSGEWVLTYSKDEENSVINSMKPDPNLFASVRVYTFGIPKKTEAPIIPQKPLVTPPDLAKPIMDTSTKPIGSSSKPSNPRITPGDPKGIEPDPNAVFSKPVEVDPKITVTISNCFEYYEALERVYNPNPTDPLTTLNEAFKPQMLNIQGNRASLLYLKEAKHGDLIVDVGGVNVRIVGDNVSNPEVFKTLAEAINYELIKKVLQ